MPQIKKRASVPFPAASMYALVNDIESYPEFLPWCRSATVLRRQDDSLEARLTITKGPITKSFATRNMLRPNHEIELQLLEGPFRKLRGLWTFEPLDEQACNISLALEFEFASRLLSMSFGPVFQQIGITMVDAFCRRARALYA